MASLIRLSRTGQDETLDGRLIYRQLWDRERKAAPHNVVVEQLVSQDRAVLFHHWRGEWVFDPLTLHRLLNKDSGDGEQRLTYVDRETAEQVARSFGQVLPSEQELRSMMGAGAAEMYAVDETMKQTPPPGDPGWPEG